MSTTPSTPAGSIPVFVFVDTNNDGKWESTEKGLPSATITLKGGVGVSLTAKTGANGGSSFPTPAPGNYQISGSIAGYVLSPAEINITVTTEPQSFGNKQFSARPVVTTVSQIATTFGANLLGASDPAGNPTLHPELAQTAAHFGFKYVRLWLEGSLLAPYQNQSTVALEWNALGVSVVGVLNFENMTPKGTVPTDLQWMAYLNSIPPAAQTGFAWLEIGNEVDSYPIDHLPYFVGSIAQYAHLLMLADPILRGKGYKILAGNCLYGLGLYEQLAALGSLVHVDAIGVHCYNNTAAAALAGYTAAAAFAAQNSLQMICTEVGLEGTPSAELPAETTKLFAGLKNIPGTFLQFPLYQIPTDSADHGFPLLANYQINAPIYSAIEAGLGIAAAG